MKAWNVGAKDGNSSVRGDRGRMEPVPFAGLLTRGSQVLGAPVFITPSLTAVCEGGRVCS